MKRGSYYNILGIPIHKNWDNIRVLTRDPYVTDPLVYVASINRKNIDHNRLKITILRKTFTARKKIVVFDTP